MNEEKKMKVWECKVYNDKIYFTGGPPPEKVDFHDIRIYANDWNLVSNIEITERKPDYQKMAENRQYMITSTGRCGNLVKATKMMSGWLLRLRALNSVSCYEESTNSVNFIPCAEPVELDPITMEPINER